MLAITDTERAQIRSDVHRFLRCTAVREGWTYEQRERNRGVLVTHSSNAVRCATIAGWLEHVLTEHGATSLSVTEIDRSTFELRWS